MNSLRALSVLDGRYEKMVNPLKDIFSEYGLFKFRIFVEIQWLIFMIQEFHVIELSEQAHQQILNIYTEFSPEQAERIKEIESITNHDVKAVEYYIKEELGKLALSHIQEWVHFSCTSEDINNIAYALMIKHGRENIIDGLTRILKTIEDIAIKHKATPMISRTHGQPASPTTVGKEMVNFAWRIQREMKCIQEVNIEAKMNGATGNYNAHSFVFPERDWIHMSERFLKNSIGVAPLLFTTQINPYNYISELLHSMIRACAVIIDLDRDMWGYISLGYFQQKLKSHEVGSSTMPHKVNPIDFENSEGNMGLAISMMEHLSVKLLQSRFQRDLTDSTVLRNMGAVFGYVLIGLKNCEKGLHKIEVDTEKLSLDLANNIELLAEPIQTLMRVYGETNPYEQLKNLTRGRKISKKDVADFIDQLTKVPHSEKERLKMLTVENYIGLSEQLVDEYFQQKKYK
ncbi:MAG: adenylosuccinate lyase [Desulfobacterales bacterium]|nr:adenylosuccinate lyase [Desulfobacterales bacterium]